MTESSKLILVIEDEADTAEMFAKMLRLSGYEVIKIVNSSEAIQIIKDKRPDAILLDLMMPEVTGLEILHAIKQDSSLSNIPFIVISAKQLPEDIKRGFEAGASEYLTKPVTFQTLQSTLETHLNSS
jgi:CheY-like chemotaxis protein